MGNDLIGHSGCEIYLIGKNKLVKKSPSIGYNDRLKEQISKQAAFQSNLINTPQIHRTYLCDDLYIIEMEYINSFKLSNYIWWFLFNDS